MTNLLYTFAQLESKKLNELKAIALQRSVTPANDKRLAINWVEAILTAQPQPVKPAFKPLVEMSGDDCIVNGEIVAAITCDEDLTQPWVVKIHSIEVHRAATWARCYDYVRTHAKYGTLPNPQPEIVDDYLFHNDIPQPAKPTEVGDSHFIGSNLLRCIEVSSEYAAVWDVIDNGLTVGEISMDWDCFWTHTLSFQSFATPQEAVVDLHESVAALISQPEFEVYPTNAKNLFAVVSRKSGKSYQVSLDSNSCTCPHWAHRHAQAGFRDKHIDAVKDFHKATQESSFATSGKKRIVAL